MKLALLTAICWAAFAASLSSCAFVPRTLRRASELEKLGALLGHWNTSGEMKDTPYSKARTKSNDEMTCSWTPNHGFLVCDQIIHTLTETRNDLSIYTYNEKQHTFSFFGLSRNDTEARTTKLTIEGSLWTYFDESDEGGKHVQFRTTNQFSSPSTVIWRSEYSEDGVHWTLMGQGTDKRIN